MPSQQIQFRVNQEAYDGLAAQGAPMRLSPSQYARLLFLLAREHFTPADVRRMRVDDTERRRRERRARAQEQMYGD